VFNAFQSVFSSFQAENLQPRRQRIAHSRDSPLPRTDSAEIWHLRAFHAGPDALEQLILLGSKAQRPFSVLPVVLERRPRLSPVGNHRISQDNRFIGSSSISSASLRLTTDIATFCSLLMSSAV
jgi:hypothetical protein